MTRRIRVGVIGLGPNGRAHLANYRAHSGAEVVAVCDVDQDLARRVAAEEGIAGVYGDLRILEHPGIDMIAVCAPNPHHGQYAVRALEAGKHVFVEKPLALEMESLERIVTLSRTMGRHVMVGHILRFNPIFQLTKHLIGEGVLGEIFYVEGDYLHDLRGYPHTEDPFGSDGVHPLDILRWYVGEPVEVQAYANRMIWPELESATTVAIYRFASGCVGKVTVSWVPVAPMPRLYNIAVYGSKATICREEICLTGTHAFVPLPVPVPASHPYTPEDRHFIDCLLEDRPPLVNAVEGARSAAAALVVKEAVRTGRAVPIPRFV